MWHWQREGCGTGKERIEDTGHWCGTGTEGGEEEYTGVALVPVGAWIMLACRFPEASISPIRIG